MDKDLLRISQIAISRVSQELSPRTSIAVADAYLWALAQPHPITPAAIVREKGIAFDTASMIIDLVKGREEGLQSLK